MFYIFNNLLCTKHKKNVCVTEKKSYFCFLNTIQTQAPKIIPAEKTWWE